MNINKINPYILNSNLSSYSSQKVKPYILVKNPAYKLPDEVSSLYEQVEYLESTGEQYIDINYQAKEGDEITVEAQFTSISENQEMGTLSGGWITYCGTYLGKFIFARMTWKTQIDADTDRHIFYLSNTTNGVAKVDDVVMPFNTSYVNTEDIFIFSRSGSVICKCKVYRVIFAEDGMIIRNFIPCYRKADNKPGLYDTVNDVFYTNANQSASQDFIVGNAVSKYIPQKVKINILSSSGRVPSEYQEVEYLESTGEQYIDTGIFSTATYSFVGKISFTAYSSQIQRVLGCTNNYQSGYPGIMIGYTNQNNSLRWRFGNGSYELISNILLNDLYEFELQYLQVVVNGVIHNAGSEAWSDMEYSFYIFANNMQGDTFNQMAKMKLYEFRVLNSNIIANNFIPCYRKADNKPGLYDTVNDVFYVNANTSASQDFIVGSDVN